MERYLKLPFVKRLTCDNACETPGFEIILMVIESLNGLVCQDSVKDAM
jgi:hypothetical protein